MIRVFDGYGREMFITRQAWRDSVLVDHLKKVWHDPQALSSTIIQALQDGFGSDMIEPAEQLAKIDGDPERAAVILAIVYREQKRLDDSEKTLRGFLARNKETGAVLTNLAKVQSERGENNAALQTLWRGLELDPNQDNGLGWYAVIHREKEGDAGAIAAWRRVAALPGSWRARLWLARDALGRKQLEEALALYREALDLAARPVPTDLLAQMSGDLGNHAHLPELLTLTLPHFEAATHGLQVGNNLIKANADLGRLEAARVILDQLYALKRPDWKQPLAYWDNELAKTHAAISGPGANEPISIAILTGNGPVWLPPESIASELFPVSSEERVRVAFLGSTATRIAPEKGPTQQLSDTAGRLSRAIPLFLAEQIHFNSASHVHPLVPWLSAPNGAFLLSGAPWSDADAAQHARAVQPPCDYVVVSHLREGPQTWTAELRLIRTIDASCLGSTNGTFPLTEPGSTLIDLGRSLVHLLIEHTGVAPSPPPALYAIPTGATGSNYLVRLEQLLAVRCGTMETAPKGFLSGVRDIIDGNLQLCLQAPGNVVTRVVLAHTLARLKKTHPQAVAEFRDKIALLQKEKRLSEPAQSVVQRMLDETFS